MENRKEFEKKIGKWLEDSHNFFNEESQSKILDLIENESDETTKKILTKFLKLSFIIKEYPINTEKLSTFLIKVD